MKYPGNPTDETPPSWYHDRVQSYIEQEFQNATEDLASAIDSEPYSTTHARCCCEYSDERLFQFHCVLVGHV